MAISLFKRIFGDSSTREIYRLQKVVQRINDLESTFKHISDKELRSMTDAFRERLAQGETLDDLLPEAFAAVREASRRTIGLRHYDVQLIGGMILHQGVVAEMRTGEGKTLVATLPLYLNALMGEGAHLVTPNDYLAKFGVQWMGPIYDALGIQVGVIQSAGGQPDENSFLYDPDYTSDDDRYQYLRPITRRAAYQADITYGTNNEFGFDYLRDNMVMDLAQCTQRALHYAIIDEVDSILIDEARTPLIISGPAEEPSELYKKFAGLVRRLQAGEDYEIDARTQTAILTEAGIAKVEQLVGIPEGQSIYDAEHAEMLPYLDNALRAKEFFARDKEYMIRDGEVIIVDEFTGRLMFGRRYSEGLHQAIEAKEGVDIRRESLTYATVTFQNFFRMYEKLAGMTGTAETEKEELRKIYALDVVVLPTNVEYRARFGDLKEHDVQALDAGVAFAGVLDGQNNTKVVVYDSEEGERYYRRLDLVDQIYKTERVKFKAVIQEIEDVYRTERPILVGTTAIETSERLSKLLKARSVPHNVLNAKYHEQEAVIIAQAGRPGAVTIATNMAGRGVDILLGGNPEGLARDTLRKEGVDLTQLLSLEWEDALKISRRGEDPTAKYPQRWAQVLYDKVRQCQENRQRIYELGGLHVIGTERHEARRIDNQLRGRAGRQGDPGSSRFYVSLEDELMRRFGGERIQPWMDRAGLEEAPLEFGVISRVIESVQERVEGYNFDIRKHVLEYDNVVNKQREVVYAERRKILSRSDLHDDLFTMVEGEIRRIVQAHTAGYEEDWNLEGLLAELRRFIPVPRNFSEHDLTDMDVEAIIEEFTSRAEQIYRAMNQQLGEGVYRNLRDDLSLKALSESSDPFYQAVIRQLEVTVGLEALEKWYEQPLRRMPPEFEEKVESIVVGVYRLFRDRRLMLRALDNHWVHHLTTLDMLREGIGLRAVGQQNPLVAYQREAYEMYQQMLESVQRTVVRQLFLVSKQQAQAAARPQSRPRLGGLYPSKLLAQRGALRAEGGSSAATSQPQTARSSGGAGMRKLGRNDPCWCGSGKKYKDCHWRSDIKAGKPRYVRETG
jgi:preprotein translocase subunit SecA